MKKIAKTKKQRMNPKIWSVEGNTYNMMEAIPGDAQARLDPAIYLLKCGEGGSIYLYKTSESFNFPYKIYGKDDAFVKRVVKTWDMSKSSMGVMLTGTKGTGKTVTAELIANEAKLPVIIVSDNYGSNMVYFINAIEQECILMFDEFEKTFAKKEDEATMLTVMDGILNSRHRKMFLLTSNNMSINDNFIDRPGRIRYVRKYRNLGKGVVAEIVEDLLQKKEYLAEVLEFISSLNLITIDIVKSVINEVNIHNEPPSKFRDIFNVTAIDPRSDLYLIEYVEGSVIPKEYKIGSGLDIQPKAFDDTTVSKGMRLKSQYHVYGKITKVLAANIIEVTESYNQDITTQDGQRKHSIQERTMLYKIEPRGFDPFKGYNDDDYLDY